MLLLAVLPAGAQSFPNVAGPRGPDQRLLHAVNSRDNVLTRSVFGVADYTAYPAYYGALPVAWGATLLTGGDSETAVRLTLSMVGSFGVVIGMKNLVRRQRPVAVHDWVIGRPKYPGGRDLDPHSWPSGHATIAAAIASTLAFQHQEWYVIAPAAFWAAAVGGSRMWLGVHYPSDVLTGWAIGFGSAWIVHRLRNNEETESLGGSRLFRFSVPIG